MSTIGSSADSGQRLSPFNPSAGSLRRKFRVTLVTCHLSLVTCNMSLVTCHSLYQSSHPYTLQYQTDYSWSIMVRRGQPSRREKKDWQRLRYRNPIPTYFPPGL